MSQFPEEDLSLTLDEGYGYFPSYPGQKLCKERYEVKRKLGYGPRSSVWLIVGPQVDEYLAVKILTARETLQKPSELDAATTAAKHGYINLYESFFENSHHGTHLCLVLDVIGPSYEDLRSSSPTKALPRHIVRRAVACVLEELEKLHNCGLIHGAVTASNIVFEIGTSRDDLEPELAKLPPCIVERRVAVHGVELPIVRSHTIPNGIKWDDSWEVINRCLINLINLGHAQKMRGTPTWEKSRVDRSLRPPEVILGLPYSAKADVWMLGCTAYHLLTGKPLVPEDKVADDEIMLSWLVAMSGGHITADILPGGRSKSGGNFFDENGSFKPEVPEGTLESEIASSKVVTAEDIPGIVEFLQACLTLDPAKRPSPDELSEHDWVRPGLEG